VHSLSSPRFELQSLAGYSSEPVLALR
jgi:hypothetical protein